MSTQHPQRIAVTVWNGRISPVFDTAREILLVDIENRTETARHLAVLAGTCPAERTTCLHELGVATVICGAVSRPMAAWCASAGIILIPFTAGEVDEVISAWIADQLPDAGFRMPGCGGQGRGRGCSRGQGQGRGRGQSLQDGRPGAGPAGECLCPQCGHRQPHQQGVPCQNLMCPECGIPMIRG